MAAGMGSRFGGLKQIEPVDPEGHIIIDFSLFDAWRAGFRDVVFIIKHEIEQAFKEAVGARAVRAGFEVRYAYQQLEKLPDVYKVITLEDRESVLRELLLVKIRVTAAQRAEIVQTAAIYKAKTIDLSPETMILELTGEGAKIDGFLGVIAPYGILEMARTGLTALHRGAACIKDGSEEV